jgi:hypothetical protein
VNEGSLLAAMLGVFLGQIGAEAAMREQNGMVLVPAGEHVVGTSLQERAELAERFDCHPTLAAAGGTSRHITIRAPALGREALGLSPPETLIWNGKAALTWRHRPDMTWTKRTPQRATYEMRFKDFRMHAEFIAHKDTVEQLFTATNLTERPATFRTSSCFNLQGHPMFYDLEQRRTYALTAKGKFVPLRRLSRAGNCVRWITGPNVAELGGNLRWALLAVVSRDGKSVIACGRAGPGSGYSLATNTLFTCLHTDSTVSVPPAGKTTTRQLFYLLEGGLDDLLKRFRTDFGLTR